jgi:hypothetical protein
MEEASMKLKCKKQAKIMENVLYDKWRSQPLG